MRNFVTAIVAALILSGCSSARDTTDAIGHGEEASEIAHDLATQHVIAGSLYELKGEYAKAVLEFQDALRYERSHGIHYALSKNYSALGKHALAIESGREAVRLAPDNVEYRRNLAEGFAAGFELDSAAAQYEEVVKRDSNSIESWFNLARLYQSRKPLKALEAYDEITKRFGPQWEVLVQIAELHNALGQFEDAADALTRMLEIDPSNQELRRSLAQTNVRAERLDEAIAIYRDLLERNPGNIEYAMELAGAYLLKQEYATAKREFDRLFESDSLGLDAKLQIGEMYFGQIEKDSTQAPVAKSIFEQIRDKHPEDWRAYWFLGAIGAVAHDDSFAVTNFRKVTELASWNPDGWVYLSSVYLDNEDFRSVVTILESALKILPDDFRVNFMLGVAHSRMGNNIEAAKVLERACVLNPKDINAIAQLALVYDGIKTYEESDSLYEAALRIDSMNHLVLNNYGYSLAERGLQLERALDMATKAVEAQPENPSYLDTKGWVYFRLGRYEEAETLIKKAIAKGNANPILHEHLGDIYDMMNESERAVEHWSIALKLDENNTVLREKISRLRH
ncbi:MAG: tetratricopeptide repeat protein [Ignavibacteriae bacterium]|nr:tetratricopeptide repeat protein [Ignavibacteriota bacterium]